MNVLAANNTRVCANSSSTENSGFGDNGVVTAPLAQEVTVQHVSLDNVTFIIININVIIIINVNIVITVIVATDMSPNIF